MANDNDTNIYLFTASETYKDDVEAEIGESGGTLSDAPNVLDKDLSTFAQYDGADALLRITLPVAANIDSVWFKSDNIAEWSLYSRSTPSASRSRRLDGIDGNSHGTNWNVGFGERGHRVWEIEVDSRESNSQPVTFFDVILAKNLVEIDEDRDRPASYRPIRSDPGANSFRTYNQNLVTYEGQSAAGKYEAVLEWNLVRKAFADTLESIWVGPPKKPILTVFVDPSDYPDQIWQMYWANEFDFYFPGPSTQMGKNGTIQFREV